jgi:ABC-type multidrug transport system ATPase subunit
VCEDDEDDDNDGYGRQALRGLSLRLLRGEFVGLVGPNGAGKTSAIRLLCGQEEATFGATSVLSQDVVSDRCVAPHTFRRMGVCPQDNSLWEDLTVEEHLTFHAALKGVDLAETVQVTEQPFLPEDKSACSANVAVSAHAATGAQQQPRSAILSASSMPVITINKIKFIINRCGLDKFTKVVSKNLSGGNQRKLHVAISLIGDPALIIMDEPSASMDPENRRGIWDILLDLKRDSCHTLLLTTHQLEEAEALSSRIGIMVKGQLHCTGSAQSLKSRFGREYHFHIVCATAVAGGAGDAAEILTEDLIRELQDRLQGLSVVGVPVAGSCVLRWSVDCLDFDLATGFTVLEELKCAGRLKVYCVVQPTLEQAFLHILKSAQEKERSDALQQQYSYLASP